MKRFSTDANGRAYPTPSRHNDQNSHSQKTFPEENPKSSFPSIKELFKSAFTSTFAKIFWLGFVAIFSGGAWIYFNFPVEVIVEGTVKEKNIFQELENIPIDIPHYSVGKKTDSIGHFKLKIQVKREDLNQPLMIVAGRTDYHDEEINWREIPTQKPRIVKVDIQLEPLLKLGCR